MAAVALCIAVPVICMLQISLRGVSGTGAVLFFLHSGKTTRLYLYGFSAFSLGRYT